MRTILLILAITFGIFFPFGHSYAFLIRYFLMLMLLFAFLDIKINKGVIERSHFIILLLNLVLPVSVFFVVNQFNNEIASTAFITALAPTAIAAPIIIKLLNGKVEYTLFSLLLTNFFIAMVIPFLIPLLINSNANISIAKILFPVLSVFLIPLALAQFLKKSIPQLHSFLEKIKDAAFYLLIINIYLGTSKASYYVSTELNSSTGLVFSIAAVTLVICFLNFYLGRLVGSKDLKLESSQSLGQKNNAFTIWVTLTFISPLAVLGPIFYVLYQNIYISWQLHRSRIKE